MDIGGAEIDFRDDDRAHLAVDLVAADAVHIIFGIAHAGLRLVLQLVQIIIAGVPGFADLMHHVAAGGGELLRGAVIFALGHFFAPADGGHILGIFGQHGLERLLRLVVFTHQIEFAAFFKVVADGLVLVFEILLLPAVFSRLDRRRRLGFPGLNIRHQPRGAGVAVIGGLGGHLLGKVIVALIHQEERLLVVAFRHALLGLQILGAHIFTHPGLIKRRQRLFIAATGIHIVSGFKCAVGFNHFFLRMHFKGAPPQHLALIQCGDNAGRFRFHRHGRRRNRR